MKKSKLAVYSIGFIIVSCFLMMTSCGSKQSGSNNSQSSEGISDKEKDKLIQSQNYRKACELKEFLTAYQIVDKLKEETSEAKSHYELTKDMSMIGDQRLSDYNEAKKKSDEAERYVVLQEAMLVLESEGTNGLMRIVGIAKEHSAEGWLYSELLDIAKKIGDNDLKERIQNIIETSE